MKIRNVAPLVGALGLVLGATTSAVATPAASTPGGLSAQVLAEKAAAPKDPWRPTAFDKKALAAKLAWIKSHQPSGMHPNVICTSSPLTALAGRTVGITHRAPQIVVQAGVVKPAAVSPNYCIYPSAAIGANQQGQAYSNYCGPASLSEMLGQLGHSVSQATLASRVGITPGNGGTDVTSFGSAVNAYSNGSWHYSFYNVAYSPSSADYANVKSYIVNDISAGYPLSGDAEEVYNGPHLTGHPNRTYTLYHWFDIRGYGNSGSGVDYEDSATTVWSTVPSYTSGFSENTLTQIVGDRGLYW